jgi:hypothetical protein
MQCSELMLGTMKEACGACCLNGAECATSLTVVGRHYYIVQDLNWLAIFSAEADLLSCRVKPKLREHITTFIASLRV